MSEVQSRPVAPRGGRGSTRNGRGGHSSRGRGSRAHQNTSNTPLPAPREEDGETIQLRKIYTGQISTIKEMFPNWTEEDILFALRETEADLELTVERITNGSISQWGEVPPKVRKDRSRSKLNGPGAGSSKEMTNQTKNSRSTRIQNDSARGGRGRGRGRGGRGRGGYLNEKLAAEKLAAAAAALEAAPWADKAAWQSKLPDIDADTSKWVEESLSSVILEPSSMIPPEGMHKSWATLFAPKSTPKKSAVPKVAPKMKRPSESSKSEGPRQPPKPDLVKPKADTVSKVPAVISPKESRPKEVPEAKLTPSKDELTENNLEQLPNSSVPVTTVTAMSTPPSSWEKRNSGEGSTPYKATTLQPQVIRQPASGFQASSLKANSSSGRVPNYQRRIFDQEEAVRMPGNREVDRTAVQFGAFGLKGSADEDVDGDREEAETRAQPPQHSPVAPRAALPPVHHQPVAAAAPPPPPPVPESLPTPKQPSGLPAANLPTSVPSLPSPAPQPVSSQQAPQVNAQYSQYGRYSQSGPPEKPFDTFSHQVPSSQSPFEGYPNHQTQTQPHAVHSGALSSAPNDYSSYYTTDPQQRNAYNSYYQQHYGSHHQGVQGQDVSVSQQRAYNAYSGPPGDSASPFPHSAAHQSHSRYSTAGEGQNSGHSTPNPVTQAPQQGIAAQAGQPQSAQQPQVPGTYPYGHPYYNSPYYAAYVNQYPSYGAGNYPGGPYAPKAAMHQQYQSYGISPGAPYDHTASPATAGFGVSSLHGRDSGLSGLSEYGRAGSSQSGQNPQALAGGAGFSSGHDAFARGSSYQGQQQQQQQGGQPHYGSQQGGQQGGDDLKPFNESKAANGPNPSLQGGRPGSATNTGPGTSALPPPHSQQAGYGGYPTHLQHQAHGIHGSQTGSQYGTLSGTGAQHQAAQGHQNSPYGGYPGFGAGNYYANSQQPQQRGGWGGNYGH